MPLPGAQLPSLAKLEQESSRLMTGARAKDCPLASISLTCSSVQPKEFSLTLRISSTIGNICGHADMSFPRIRKRQGSSSCALLTCSAVHPPFSRSVSTKPKAFGCIMAAIGDNAEIQE